MSNILRASQVVAASDLSKEVDRIKLQVIELIIKARHSGLLEQANELESVREHLYEVSSSLEYSARNTFFAARRGEGLPK